MVIEDLLRFMVTRKASDMHLKAMRPPLLRIERELAAVGDQPLSPEQIREMLLPILNESQRAHLEEKLWVELGYSVQGVSRFRVSITHQRGSLAAAFRRIPFEFPSLDEWGLPDVLREFTQLQSGLVLVTGPTGSGKSSTLAALLRLVCETRPLHIITIEDPIEFLISDDVGAICQREVGTDTLSFADALRNVLRQDPDAIVIGEMRDRETISTAMTAAETGHLVFSTLHTNSASQTIDRCIDAFPPRQQEQVRAQLGQVLQGVVSLKLVNRKDGDGLVAAVEVLKSTPRIVKLIEEGKIAEIENEIERSVTYYRMQSTLQSLMALVLNGVVSFEVGKAAAPKPEDFDREMRKLLFKKDDQTGDSDMADSKADFSKIVELQEIQRLYEESQERHMMEMSERDRIIEGLQNDLQQTRAQLQTVSETANNAEQLVSQERQNSEKVRQELEGKVAKLQARVKELQGGATQSAGAGGGGGGRKGFFSR